MFTVDLTPAVPAIPPRPVWHRDVAELMLEDQNRAHAEDLRELENGQRMPVRLSPVSIDETKWPNDILPIYRASYPLRELSARVPCEVSPQWLAYWEAYARCIIGPVAARIKMRGRKTKTRFNSFHIRDPDGVSIRPAQYAVKKIESTAGAIIIWNWLATYVPDDDTIRIETNWVQSVDGFDAMNVANMRAWRNKIITTLRAADLIVCNSDSDEDKPASIAFALLNLAPGGSAVIRIPQLATTSTAAMIHLAAQCFGTTTIIHTMAADTMFLCCEDYRNGLSTRQNNQLYEFCATYRGTPMVTPWTKEYIDGPQFTYTAGKLAEMNAAVHKWRLALYRGVLDNYERFGRSASAQLFDNYAREMLAYKDESAKWIARTGYNYFARAG